jgi:hypothetical protein
MNVRLRSATPCAKLPVTRGARFTKTPVQPLCIFSCPSHRNGKRFRIVCGAAAKPWSPKDGRLVLADGTVMKGRTFGASGTRVAEVVFNTSLSGYQEIMTDPSYRDQMVCFTYPHIGNVGINEGATVTPLERCSRRAWHHGSADACL